MFIKLPFLLKSMATILVGQNGPNVLPHVMVVCSKGHVLVQSQLPKMAAKIVNLWENRLKRKHATPGLVQVQRNHVVSTYHTNEYFYNLGPQLEGVHSESSDFL